MQKNSKLFLAGFALVCFGLGAGAYRLMYSPASAQVQAPQNTAQPASLINQPRPDFALKDVNDKRHDISEWNGKVIVLNFWATWCPPCRREIPGFINLYKKYKDQGLEVVGVAVDTQKNTASFLDSMGINYPILVGEQAGIDLTQEYGNDLGVLPYTVIIDRKGVVRKIVPHEISEKQVTQLIQPLL